MLNITADNMNEEAAKEAVLAFKVLAVDSIPCDVRGNAVAFDAAGNICSGKMALPWPMPWIEEELSKLAADQSAIAGVDKIKVYNPEEDDQFVFVEIYRA